MRIPAATSTLILYFLTVTAGAQWYDRIRTESDWDELYAQGIIDYNSYVLCLELAEGAVTSDTSDYLVSSMGIDPVDIIGYQAGSGISPSHPEASLATTDEQSPRIDLRLGRKISGEENTGYYSFAADYDKISTYLKIRDNDGRAETSRRTVVFRGEEFKLTAGNFTGDIGCGLVIGKFDYRPISYEPKFSDLNEFLYPDNSYYNGFKFEHDDLFAGILSFKKYYGVTKTFSGGAVLAGIGNYSIGSAAGATVFRSGAESRTMGAVSVFAETRDRKLKSELAYAESGLGGLIKYRMNGWDIRAWYYQSTYLNLQSSGYANPDYESFRDDRFELAFRRPQSGETGIYTGKNITIGKAELTAASEIWQKSASQPAGIYNLIDIRYNFDRPISASARIAERLKDSGRRRACECGARYSSRIRVDLFFTLIDEDGDLVDDKSKYYIYSVAPLTDKLILSGRIRRSVSGKLDYFIEERASLGDGLSLKITYRWEDSYGHDQGPVYLICENRW